MALPSREMWEAHRERQIAMRRETIRERSEREMKERTDAFRHAVLLGLVFATLILTGILQGCAGAEVDDWSPAPVAPKLPMVLHRVDDPYTLWAICKASTPNVVGCAIRDYTRGVCDVYVDGQWIVPHEQHHCDGYDHAPQWIAKH